MRRVLALIAFAAIALALPPLPRPAPAFTIAEPGGRKTPLSAYKGKVVLLGFFSTTCPHCQQTSKTFSGLQQAFGGEGLQALAVTFNPEAASESVVREFKDRYAQNYPVGASVATNVLDFLGISVMERYVYPQIVLIDRKGMIRAQSDPKGTPELQDLTGLRPKIEALLKER
jgi:peroxiredoxin